MTLKKHKLNIFQVLGNLNKKDKKFYPSLSEDEKKAFMPLVIMRWMSGIKCERQIIFLNELVNPFVFSLQKHKQLLVNLLMISGPGHTQRYTWIKAKGKQTSAIPNTTSVICEYFNYNTRKALDAFSLLSDSCIIEYAEELGRQPDEIKKIKKELKSNERPHSSM